ncbi:ThiF family adenylyltransferase [Lysobacter sp. MMG2]|nr:ThiF family adenylyltransferase [Lysobacter sp. MMG2]
MLDIDFPRSEPRIIAPQAAAIGAPAWPHVEKGGVLCLSATRFSAPAGQRALTVLQDALDVLDLDDAGRVAEFRRELAAYWSQRVGSGADTGLALLRAEPVDRDIFYHRGPGARIVFADTEDELERWLKNRGVECRRPLPQTRLAWPAGLRGPDTFPKTGRDVIDMVGPAHLDGKFPAGGEFPVVLGAMVDEAPIFVGTVLRGAPQKMVMKGFRPSRPRPQWLVADLFRAREIHAISIERLDAAWIHGRDANSALGQMQAASVAIVGCGALGGFLARGLVQAGVGSLVLVDHDSVKAANLGRHVLGAEWLGRSKANALAEQLARDFPHAKRATAHHARFQDLSSAQLQGLADCDVVVLAGVDLPAELAVDRWSATLEHAPVRVWTWTEEFALAGQAISLFGTDSLEPGLDADGRFIKRATSRWDPRTTTLGEAGCGTSFQPYDAADMMHTVLMGQRLVADVLLGKVGASLRRTWFGDREAVVAQGGEPSVEFDRSFTEKTYAWPP